MDFSQSKFLFFQFPVVIQFFFFIDGIAWVHIVGEARDLVIVQTIENLQRHLVQSAYLLREILRTKSRAGESRCAKIARPAFVRRQTVQVFKVLSGDRWCFPVVGRHQIRSQKQNLTVLVCSGVHGKTFFRELRGGE